MNNEWFHVKDKLPPLFEFVEVIVPDKVKMNDLRRDFLAFVHWNEEYYWSNEFTDERDDLWGIKWKVKYWRPMIPDHLGRKAFIRLNRQGPPKIYFKKVKVES